MSEVSYTGTEEDWEVIWDLIGRYTRAENIPFDTRVLIGKAMTCIVASKSMKSDTPNTSSGQSSPLTMNDLVIGKTYRFSVSEQGLNGIQVMVSEKRRTRITVTLLESPTSGKYSREWKPGYKLQCAPSHLVNV